MNRALSFLSLGLGIFVCGAQAQQVADRDYQPPVENPTFGPASGPRVAIDEAHHNFHTIDGRYQPFANLLKRDGYRVEGFKLLFSSESLKEVDILVIANPVNERNVGDWSLPTPSAFTTEEIADLVAWVKEGGSLFLIADHMPFPGAAGELGKAFGVEFSNGYARTGRKPGERGPDVFSLGKGLVESGITRGWKGREKVDSVATFGGSAFKLPEGSTPVLVFGEGSVSRETTKAPGITPDAPRVAIEGWSQGAVLEAGKGRVAVFGEASMFSAQRAGAERRPMGMNAPDAKQNHQLALNVVRWLARAEEKGE